MHLHHHQVAQVSVQGDEEGEALVARNALSAVWVGWGGVKMKEGTR